MWPRATRRPTERHPGRRCAARASGTRAAPGRGAEAAPHGPCEPASPGTQKPGRPLGRSGRGRGCCLQPRPASFRTASGPAAACGQRASPDPARPSSDSGADPPRVCRAGAGGVCCRVRGQALGEWCPHFCVGRASGFGHARILQTCQVGTKDHFANPSLRRGKVL